MDFIELFNLPSNANIIDVGGGDSQFVDALLDKGYQNIYMFSTFQQMPLKEQSKIRHKSRKSSLDSF